MAAETWQAGVASSIITPPAYMPMAGYASRGRKPAESKLTELWAKALVLQPTTGDQIVLVTLDLIGMERTLGNRICTQLAKRYGLQRSQIALSTSHTHTGPIIQGNLRPMYDTLLTAEDREQVQRYAAQVE
ncbi:MAG: neutral/alkaline non-lysosomal ceramidase N-terminal domain-containing protein, partial [Planctomycetaceae bacterium]|nr:neutral/alkaline non-lysosomal ceramidase N-terminal domain-containing protein [Planctomycetaceae bacterium]